MSTTMSGSNGGLKRPAASLDADLVADGSNNNSSGMAHSSSVSHPDAELSSSSSPPPPEKRSFIVVESPIKLGAISSAEDLDIKVLRLQNKNLSERLLQRQKLEAELREKITRLQGRKVDDDTKLCVFDRFWTQLDEDLRLLLERFDSASSCDNVDTADSSSKSHMRKFLAKLNDWDKKEIEEVLVERIKFTTQAVAKLVTNYDRLLKKREASFKELIQSNKFSDSEGLKEVMEENVRLNELITKYQERVHSTGLERKELEDRIVKLENELKDLKSKCDESEYELERMSDKAHKLDRQLADTLIKLNNMQTAVNSGGSNHSLNHQDQNGRIVYHNNTSTTAPTPSVNNKGANPADKQLADIQFELEQQRELASSRLHELEKLNSEHQASIRQIEKLKADAKLSQSDGAQVENSSEFRMLQTKYTLIVNDNMRLRQALEESRHLLEQSRVAMKQNTERMESQELADQKKFATELLGLEEQVAQLKKTYELLRIDYEQNMAANEQTGPINKEMRSLITTLQTNNKLSKSENVRLKKKVDEVTKELEASKKQTSDLQIKNQQLEKQMQHSQQQQGVKKEGDVKQEPTSGESDVSSSPVSKSEPSDSIDSKEQIIQELREKNRKLEENLRDVKNSLDIYKSSSPTIKQAPSSPKTSGGVSTSAGTPTTSGEKRKHDLEAANEEIKRLKHVIDKLKVTNSNSKHIPSSPVSGTQHSIDDTPGSSSTSASSSSQSDRKVRQLEEQIKELHKVLSNKKQEEVVLCNDLEVTGQAFEDMQEQNDRLIQQLRAKDDANFKLVSERIKLESVQKILKEEKELLVQQVTIMQEQQEANASLSKKLDEQIQVLTQSGQMMEKELVQAQHTCEYYKRQALDNVQLIQDLRLQSQKYLLQLKEAQEQVAEKSEQLTSQVFVNKRAQEDLRHLNAKLERQKKFENATSLDEVLQEEIREYKEQLRCPSCKVKQKDAVLTKCYHVFCFDCLQKRYDTRQRKCPKCNANFGANDFRKLYLS